MGKKRRSGAMGEEARSDKVPNTVAAVGAVLPALGRLDLSAEAGR
jgi:hypothetical protein